MNPQRALVRFASSGVASAGLGAFVALLERVSRWPAWSLPVLTYHRVDQPSARPELYPGLLSADPKTFALQAAYLARHCRVIGLEDLIRARQHGSRLPPRSVLVTFDDAYRDFAEHAWPILRHYRLPATLFVPTAFPGAPEGAFWWDRLWAAMAGAATGATVETPAGALTLTEAPARRRAFRTLRESIKGLDHDRAMATVDAICGPLGAPPLPRAVLNWDELRSLAHDGVTLAPHSRTHPLLSRIPASRLPEEVGGSWHDLRERVGPTPPAFAYPGGAFDDTVLAAVAEAGLELAFTTDRGLNDLRAPDWLRLRRINVGGATTLPLLRLQLLPRVARPPLGVRTGP